MFSLYYVNVNWKIIKQKNRPILTGLMLIKFELYKILKK